MTGVALREQARSVKTASSLLALAPDETRRGALRAAARGLRERSAEVLAVNAAELAAFEGAASARDRLRLDEARVAAMADSLVSVAELPDPLGEVVGGRVTDAGLEVAQVRVPLGVVGVIYENRPNVTTDVAGLCVRSGNAAFLRGSASAQRTNEVLVELWGSALASAGLPVASVSLVSDTSHEAAAQFMGLVGYIDCLVPRGGPGLVAAMREHARVPYVLDGDGNCHIYVDEAADLDMALAIVVNAKVSRPGVCNAAETLLVHRAVAGAFLPALSAAMPTVELRADARARALLPGARAASDEDFAREFLDLVLAVGVVDDLDGAIGHIGRYSSGHSEAIVTDDDVAAARFVREVDAAAVLVNASTRFVDGGELGLGAEVGISTQKLHARGPMGLRELTCLKWVIKGKGQIR
jgi:glutamate-5-semialdehyde dehydrogenase